ncbi:MAG: methyl-accepting chemotaxis protein [Synergistaceae bacterium]|nr:methyl-accepting chemotaxis protein [Synergistaceae bacterium]
MKNLRMTSKLMLGFGIVLVVFTVAVVLTWINLKKLTDGSTFLQDSVVPAMQYMSSINSDAYELFLTVRETQYTETAESIADDDKKIAVLEKSLANMEDLGAKYPTMQSPKMVRDSILPVHKNYVDIVEKVHAAIAKKDKGRAALGKAGSDVYESLKKALDSFYNTMKNSNLSDAKAQERVDNLYRVSKMLADAVEMRRELVVAVDVAHDVKAMRETGEIAKSIQQAAQTVLDLVEDPERQNLMKSILSQLSGYSEDLENLIKAYEELNGLNEARKPVMLSYNTETSKIAGFAQDTVKTVAGTSLTELNTTTIVLLASAALAIVLGLLIAFFISRSISKPLNTIVDLAKRCQEGDMTIQRADFGYEGKDELGNLVGAMSEMIITQEAAMQNVVSVADAVGNGANSLSAIAEETNASMEEVKASLDQVASLSQSNGAALEESNAGVEEMSAGADTVAQSSTESASFIAQTTEASGKAIETVNAVIEGMKNADKNSRESEAKIRELVSSVENVSSFVSVITGIADQTNLLALNAAIEAARAGEVGRGFAVVAEEVRKLAEESARAAQNVNGIIVELQKQAQESISATTEAGKALSETLTQASEAQKQLDDALKQINKANDSIQNIAAVAQEQAASSKEVATAIDNATKSTVEMADTVSNIQHATEETAKAAQGVAEQAESMSENAQSLTEALSHFKLRTSKAKTDAVNSANSNTKNAKKAPLKLKA